MTLATIENWKDCRILVTNDDGIYAPGLAVMEDIANQLSDHVTVCAPETEQSGAGHSLSLNRPLRYQHVEDNRYFVKGTPTDCVLFAADVLAKKRGAPFDLVLSGVNRGANLGEDVTHSGTLAAAMEGTLCGIPSIALSQLFSMWDPEATLQWDLPRHTAADLIRRIMRAGIAPNTLINLNFPDCRLDDCRGVRVTEQGQRSFGKNLDTRHDRKGNPYYWVHWGDGDEEFADGTDLAAVYQNEVSVTPLTLNLTHYDSHNRLRDAMLEAAGEDATS